MNKTEKVKNYIISLIIGSYFEIGSTIPSERSLTRILNVSRITVRNALSNLTHSQWIQPKRGSGYVVCGYGNYDVLFAKGKYKIKKTKICKLMQEDFEIVEGCNIKLDQKSHIFTKKYFNNKNELIMYTINSVPKTIIKHITKNEILNGYIQSLISKKISISYQDRSIAILENKNKISKMLKWKESYPVIITFLHSKNEIIESSLIVLNKNIFEFTKKIFF